MTLEADLLLVAPIARGMVIPDSIEFDDALSDGALGCMKAERLFDPSRGVPYLVWLRLAIRRGILDGVRARHGRAGNPRRTPLLSLEGLVESGFDRADLAAGRFPDQVAELEEAKALLALLEPGERDAHLAGKDVQRAIGTYSGGSGAGKALARREGVSPQAISERGKRGARAMAVLVEARSCA